MFIWKAQTSTNKETIISILWRTILVSFSRQQFHPHNIGFTFCCVAFVCFLYYFQTLCQMATVFLDCEYYCINGLLVLLRKFWVQNPFTVFKSIGCLAFNFLHINIKRWSYEVIFGVIIMIVIRPDTCATSNTQPPTVPLQQKSSQDNTF